MYIKWIVCEVKENQKDEFSNAQEKWTEIKNLDGFISQVGGWNQKRIEEAYIISFWENEESLNDFMENIHDEIFFAGNQKQTYQNISVKYFDSELDDFGGLEGLKRAIESARVLDELIGIEGKDVLLVDSWKILK